MTPTFFRGSLPNLWIGFSASSPLGLVDGVHFVQDDAGVGGQVSLVHQPSATKTSVPMALWGDAGTDLGGHVPMAGLPAGEYRIFGQVVGTNGAVALLNFLFLLVDGPAPQNGAVPLSMAPPPVPSVPFPALGPAVVAMLRPGTSVAFEAAGAAAVFFSPITTTLEFP